MLFHLGWFDSQAGRYHQVEPTTETERTKWNGGSYYCGRHQVVAISCRDFVRQWITKRAEGKKDETFYRTLWLSWSSFLKHNPKNVQVMLSICRIETVSDTMPNSLWSAMVKTTLPLCVCRWFHYHLLHIYMWITQVKQGLVLGNKQDPFWWQSDVVWDNCCENLYNPVLSGKILDLRSLSWF